MSHPTHRDRIQLVQFNHAQEEWDDDEASRIEALPEQVKCSYCGNPDSTWTNEELLRGKRGLQSGEPGVEYHCVNAFYGAQ